jgi:hypothetical protein
MEQVVTSLLVFNYKNVATVKTPHQQHSERVGCW